MRALLLGLAVAACSGPATNVCTPACGEGRTCCGGTCVNANNDPKNCGACGTVCSGAAPLCEGGTCKAPPCNVDGGSCAGGALCCGASCCGAGQLCCSVEGPVGGLPPECFTPTGSQSTCPQGCSPQCVSDRAVKSAVVPVDERQVLERVASLPLSTWTYRFDPAGTRHLGPMAQDFHDAFSLGASSTSYDPVDAHGVSLASIKALAAMVAEQRARLDRLEAQNEALRHRVCRQP